MPHSFEQLSQALRSIVGRDAVITDLDELLVYECDGLPQHKHPPRAVVFPHSTEEVSEVLRILAGAGVPFSPRGAGTGLSGGALAIGHGIIIELAHMRRLLRMDAENRLAVVETGMVNAQLSRAAAPFGLHYVPDPSSQATCTIGGNIAENAGGIHCLKYGMTVDHVLAAKVVLAGGEIVDLDSTAPGYDLLGVFIGSEGTFGIATEATLRLVPIPPAVRTLLADFNDVNDASHAVSAIIAAGLVPAALEMIDGATIRAVEASVFAAGLPPDAEAALLIELDGLEAGLDQEAAHAESICLEHGARHVRRAADEMERKRIWMARKGAFGAMGRISPDLMLQDAVVPRSRLPEVLAEIYGISAKYNLRIANLFHAGDGNLHPVICFDSRHRDEIQRVKEAGREIMETCVRAGGTITGEHGVGLDKSEYLPLIFSADDMDTMLRIRAAFDPDGLCNPGKIIPTSRSCGEARTSLRNSARPIESTTVEKATLSNAIKNAATSGWPKDAAQREDVPVPAHQHPPASRPAARLAQIVGDEHVCDAAWNRAVAVSPASIEEACEVLRLATREGWSVVPAGAGTWLDRLNPARPVDVLIRTTRLQRLIEHEPADLIATAEAGLRLKALNTELERAGQWLPLDPPDDGRVTVGGVVATGLAGAQSFAYGAPRAFVIGMRVALADGRLVKAGGRVVKNVAGYDLCKLFTGSFGTLGLILEMTFKLRPLPAQTTTIIAAGPLASLLNSARALLAARLFPAGLELLSTGLAQSTGAVSSDQNLALMVRFDGTGQAVAYQAEQARLLLQKEGGISSIEVARDGLKLWSELAALPLRHSKALTWRAQVQPTQLGPFLNELQTRVGPGFSSSLWQAGMGCGRVRFINPALEDISSITALAQLRAKAQAMGGSLVMENAPVELRQAMDAPGELGQAASLMKRIKRQLDPGDVFCPELLFASTAFQEHN